MTTTSDDSLLIDLGHSRVDFRRDALAALAPRAGGFLSPAAVGALRKMALEDSDVELRRGAALAFLTNIWRFHDFRRALPLLATAEPSVLAAMCEEPRPAERVAPQLATLVAATMNDASATTRRAALSLLEPIERFGGNVDFAKPMLLDALSSGDASERAVAAELLRKLRIDLQPHVARFTALAASSDLVAQTIGGGFLARAALMAPANDERALIQLVRHDRVAVREAAAAELAAAARAGVDLNPATTALGIALGDDAGGVHYFALRALVAAASSGLDIAPVVADLIRQLRRAAYALTGWAQTPTGLARAQIERESPAQDAMRALLLHHLRRGEADAVEALLQRDDLSDEVLMVAEETVKAAMEAPEFADFRPGK